MKPEKWVERRETLGRAFSWPGAEQPARFSAKQPTGVAGAGLCGQGNQRHHLLRFWPWEAYCPASARLGLPWQTRGPSGWRPPSPAMAPLERRTWPCIRQEWEGLAPLHLASCFKREVTS